MRVLIAIASCVLIVGCSSGNSSQQAAPKSPNETTSPSTSPSPSSSSPPTSAASSDPCNLLSESELQQLAGAAVGAARPGLTGGMANCQWTAANGRFVQAIGAPSPYWAQSLPAALRAVEASGQFTDAKNLKQLRAGAELIRDGQDLDPVEACSLFSEMLELQGQPEGSPWIVLVAPTRDNPQAITGQMCSGGRFTSVMVADQAGLEAPLPEDQVARALKSAHRKNLG